MEPKENFTLSNTESECLSNIHATFIVDLGGMCCIPVNVILFCSRNVCCAQVKTDVAEKRQQNGLLPCDTPVVVLEVIADWQCNPVHVNIHKKVPLCSMKLTPR